MPRPTKIEIKVYEKQRYIHNYHIDIEEFEELIAEMKLAEEKFIPWRLDGLRTFFESVLDMEMDDVEE